MKEWKPIKGYETLYKVSSKGDVLSIKSNKILKPIDSHSYKYVHLCDINHIRRNKAIHRLVADTFIPTKDNSLQINHKDGNKANNSVDNLEWCTPAENSYHRAKVLKRNTRKVYCIETKQTFDSIQEASDYYHKSQSSLVAVLKRYKYNKTFAGKHWIYI